MSGFRARASSWGRLAALSGGMAGEKLGPEIQKLQQHYQRPGGTHVYLLGKADKLTSVGIPGVMAAVAGSLLIGGLYQLYTGTGKGDQ
ncbi:hypothetical protein WJX73_001653 [Symbiochloris irregularis]|uniref:Uncharacterized protein n=1 Tax=Symbiochloris irregularis TaxID=706552 RepID=A0AAW1Q3F0_9CHLO